jgi:hypothetical protein
VLFVGPLELRETRHEKPRIVERDEGALEARAPQEANRSRVKLFWILDGDQVEQGRCLVEPDVR